MAEIASAFVTLIPSFRGGQAAIAKELDQPAQSAGKSTGGRFSRAFTLAAKTGGLAAAAGLGTAIVKGFGRLSAIEDAKAKLMGLGNSTKSVKVIMDNALASVKGTAFGLDEAATTAAGAVAAGVKPGKNLERALKLVADSATIAGTDMGTMGAIFNKVAAGGMVQMDVINQLQDAGIPALSLLADQLGVTAGAARKMASDGKIDFETFQKAMQKGLGGAALESGKTTSGAFKNMNAALSRFGATLLTGVYPLIGPLFVQLTKGLDQASKGVKALSAFVKRNRTTFKVLGGILAAIVVPYMVAATVAFVANLASVVALNTAWAVYGIVVKSTAIATKIFTAAQWLMNAALTANPIGLIILALVALGAGLVLAYKKSETFRAIVDGAFSAVSAVIGATVGFVKAHLKTIGLVLLALTGPVGIMAAIFIKNFGRIKSAASSAVNFFKGIPGAIKSFFSNAPSMLLNAGKQIVAGLASGIRRGVGSIKSALLSLLPGPLKHFAGKLGIASPSKVFQGFGLNIGQGLVKGVDQSRSSVTAAAGRLADSVAVPAAARFGSGSGGGPASAGVGAHIEQNIYPQPGQSETEIGRASANALLFKMAVA